jgi:nicotinate-nucleotide adenylyltransferase
MPKVIAVFGGAFDPVHLDHAAIGRGVLDRALADEVWFVPCPDRWDKRLFAPADHRLAMLRLALGDEPRFVISDLEIQLGEFRGTYQFLLTLAGTHPDCEFRLVIGADSYATIPKWRDPLRFFGTEYNGLQLLREFSLIIFAREGSTLPSQEEHGVLGYRPFAVVGPGEGFSGSFASSEIRDVLLHHKRQPPGLDPRVYEYIVAQELYTF